MKFPVCVATCYRCSHIMQHINDVETRGLELFVRTNSHCRSLDFLPKFLAFHCSNVDMRLSDELCFLDLASFHLRDLCTETSGHESAGLPCRNA